MTGSPELPENAQPDQQGEAPAGTDPAGTDPASTDPASTAPAPDAPRYAPPIPQQVAPPEEAWPQEHPQQYQQAWPQEHSQQYQQVWPQDPSRQAPHYGQPPQYAQPQPQQQQPPQYAQPQPQQQQPQQYAQPQQQQQYAQQQYAQYPSADPAQATHPQQFSPGTPYSPAPKRGLPTGAIIGIVAGAVVLLMIVGGLFALGALFDRSVGRIAGSGSGGSSSSVSPETAAAASAAVEEYLTALAAGDATTARKLAGGSASDTMLNDDVLAESLKRAPISDISVAPAVADDMGYGSVLVATASFSLGDTPVTREFRLWDYSDSWELEDALVRVSVYGFEGLGLTFNGEAAIGGSVALFPGVYQLGVETEEFGLSTDSDLFTLVDSSDAEALYEVKPELTPEATEVFRSLVSDSVEECLALDTLLTPCGFEVSEDSLYGPVPVEGTVKRSLSVTDQALLKSVTPVASYEAPSVVSGRDMFLTAETTVQATSGNTKKPEQVETTTYALVPYVDFSDEKPVVVWE
ncbi:hypothetical protein [Leucobacter luti]|uniref:Uncharacterized protein n=1 Tax=Leucobacter luti TaxID=340320 RepID=A0A4Q7TPC7_9MICO|nr:hypothetical protein [Leucobacter luti]MBL3700137.1 hypothetical protein [Leucobacter luti]RZT61142.1 hypothetical protein EV139_2894 [Leucobacter luti]